MRKTWLVAGLLASCVTTPASDTGPASEPPACAALAAHPTLWRGFDPPPLDLRFHVESLEMLRRRVLGEADEHTAPIALSGPDDGGPLTFCVRHGTGRVVFAASFLAGHSAFTDVTVHREPPTPTQTCAAKFATWVPPIEDLLVHSEPLLTARWGTPEAVPAPVSSLLWTRHDDCRCDGEAPRCARITAIEGRFTEGRADWLRWRALLDPG